MPVKLHIDDISLNFGGIKALNKVGFQVAAGEIFAVIGPNGAGKTSPDQQHQRLLHSSIRPNRL